MTGALDGLLIADFGRVLAGPYATMLLADFGAEVVKIERPHVGDDTRSWGPPWVGGQSTYFLGVNRNKRSVAIDLSTEAGLTAARALIARADVVVENFLPGTMDRLGLGYEHARALKPDVVYCSITGFGGDTVLPGYDLLVQAVGGLMSITGPDSRTPTKVGVAVVDVITGLHAALGILTALRHRDRSGDGQHVEVDLMSSLLSALTNQSAGYVATGSIPSAMGNRHPSIAPYEVFRAADKPFVVAVGNDRQFRSLADAVGMAELADEHRFATNSARVAHREELATVLDAVLQRRTAQTWFTVLTAARVPCGPVNNIADAVGFAEELGLDPVVDIVGSDREDPIRQIRNPIRLSATPATYRTAPPALPGAGTRRGADNAPQSGS